MNAQTTKIVARFGQSVKSKEEVAELLKQKDQVLQEMQSERQAIIDAGGNPARIREIDAQIDAVKRATPSYDPTLDKQLQSQERQAYARAHKDRETIVSVRADEIQRMLNGRDFSILQTLIDKRTGKNAFSGVVHDRVKNELILTPAGGGVPSRISLNTSDGGQRAMNELLNKTTGETVSIDEVLGFGSKYNIQAPVRTPEEVKLLKQEAEDFSKNVYQGNSKQIGKMNNLALQGELMLPDVPAETWNRWSSNDVEENINGMRATIISYRQPMFSSAKLVEIPFSYSDDKGESKSSLLKIDVTTDAGKKFIDELISYNSAKLIGDNEAADPSQQGQQTQQIPEGSVLMIRPSDGKTVAVLPENVEKAKAKGYTIK
jgi:hypothetical protein